jgi:hypothetical protein
MEWMLLFLLILFCLVLKLFHEVNEEPNDLTRRMNQLVEIQQVRDQVNENFQEYQDKMKEIFDRKEKERSFLLGDLVLRWDARREDPGKHGKFDPYGLDHSKLHH